MCCSGADFARRCEDNSSTLAYLIDQLKVQRQADEADVEMDDSSRQEISAF